MKSPSSEPEPAQTSENPLGPRAAVLRLLASNSCILSSLKNNMPHRYDAGENACVVVDGDEYILFHSLDNGIGMKRSLDLANWMDIGVTMLGQADWPWAAGRITAGFVLDLRTEPNIGKYLMFFHGSGPEDETTMFDCHASLGIAWSDDLRSWEWPAQSSISNRG